MADQNAIEGGAPYHVSLQAALQYAVKSERRDRQQMVVEARDPEITGYDLTKPIGERVTVTFYKAMDPFAYTWMRDMLLKRKLKESLPEGAPVQQVQELEMLQRTIEEDMNSMNYIKAVEKASEKYQAKVREDAAHDKASTLMRNIKNPVGLLAAPTVVPDENASQEQKNPLDRTLKTCIAEVSGIQISGTDADPAEVLNYMLRLRGAIEAANMSVSGALKLLMLVTSGRLHSLVAREMARQGRVIEPLWNRMQIEVLATRDPTSYQQRLLAITTQEPTLTPSVLAEEIGFLTQTVTGGMAPGTVMATINTTLDHTVALIKKTNPLQLSIILEHLTANAQMLERAVREAPQNQLTKIEASELHPLENLYTICGRLLPKWHEQPPLSPGQQQLALLQTDPRFEEIDVTDLGRATKAAAEYSKAVRDTLQNQHMGFPEMQVDAVKGRKEYNDEYLKSFGISRLSMNGQPSQATSTILRQYDALGNRTMHYYNMQAAKMGIGHNQDKYKAALAKSQQRSLTHKAQVKKKGNQRRTVDENNVVVDVQEIAMKAVAAVMQQLNPEVGTVEKAGVNPMQASRAFQRHYEENYGPGAKDAIPPPPKGACFLCLLPGHGWSNCPWHVNQKKAPSPCYKCRSGAMHYANKCKGEYPLKGNPPAEQQGVQGTSN